MITRFVAALLLTWILGFIWFAVTLPRPADSLRRTDAIVALTGEGARIERALDMLDARAAPRLLISGVDRDVRPGELAALYHRDAAQFACCVDLGFKAVDTRSNAVETFRWTQSGHRRSIRLVTSDWHMKRARLELDLVTDGQIKIVEDAVQTLPSLRILIIEYHKYLLRLIAAVAGV